MSAASEALTDVRGWLCDNLSEGDAGKICGMLSVVSRHIVALEDENERLRSCLSDDAENARQIMGENAKLRELCKDIWNDALHFEGFWDYVHDDGTIYREDELPHYQERMRECGIEVK